MKCLCSKVERKINLDLNVFILLHRLVQTLLHTVKKQFYLLKGHGVATSDIVGEYDSIVRQVQGEREIMWADQSMNETLGIDLQSSGSTSSLTIAAGSDFDINAMMDFPVLSCANLTRKY